MKTPQHRHPSQAFSSIAADQRGLSTVEYVIILVLLAAVAIGTWSAFGQKVKCALGLVNAEMAQLGGDLDGAAANVCPKGGSAETPSSAATVASEPAVDEPPKIKRVR
jgi:Flp pilus assembly pilin Flp